MALPPPIRRLLVRPDNTEKVELFGPDEGLYGFRLWQHKRKAWRHAGESNGFESYAGAVVEAARQIDWIERALSQQSDWRHSYQLELLRGLTFQFDLYEEQRYGDHDHCSACSVKLAEHDWQFVELVRRTNGGHITTPRAHQAGCHVVVPVRRVEVQTQA